MEAPEDEAKIDAQFWGMWLQSTCQDSSRGQGPTATSALFNRNSEYYSLDVHLDLFI